MGFGDAIERALTLAGITSERVEQWLGNCGCKERRDKLNALGWWAARVLAGRSHNAMDELRRIVED